VTASAEPPLSYAIRRLAHGADLTASEAAGAFEVVLRGEATPAQIAALLMALRVKGETVAELAGLVRAMRAAMVRLDAESDGLVDTCGTGGGSVGTLNVSTAAAFVVAGAGVPVAKHGNRSYTSRCGSADVLEALGVDIGLDPARAAAVLREAGIVFLFAPTYHPAMRHVGPTRRELGVPTVMNLLGPLLNPAGVRRQVVGVADAGRAPVVAGALAELGSAHALVVHGEIGMDEISPAGETRCWEVRDGVVREWRLSPRDYGLEHDELAPLAGGEPSENAARIEALLCGSAEPVVRAAVLLNAAATLYVAGRGWSFGEAVDRAGAALASGDGARALTRLRTAAGRRRDGASTSG
jgi:anthranilate phosphoribosyltransferase